MIDVHQNSNFIQKIWRTTSRVLSEIAVKEHDLGYVVWFHVFFNDFITIFCVDLC